MTDDGRDLIILPDRQSAASQLALVRDFQATVREVFQEGLDYGKPFPGSDKQTLLKPGAEKLAKLLHLADTYETISKVEDWDKPLFHYEMRCSLVIMGTDTVVSQGVGSCNSMEDKYRWRTASLTCPACGGAETVIKGKAEFGGGWLCWAKKGGCGAKFADGTPEIENQPRGRVPNDDIFTQVNTILKMAKKRSMIDAALSAGRLSDIFTQDIEDMLSDPEEPTARTVASTPAPQREAAAQKRESFSRAVSMAESEDADGRGLPTHRAKPAVTDDGDALWTSWCNRVAEAEDLQLPVPTSVVLPIDRDELVGHINALTNAIMAARRSKPAAKVIEHDETSVPWEPDAPAAEAEVLCEDCRSPLTDTTFKDGKVWTVADLAAAGKKKFGAVLCMKDYSARNAKLRVPA